MKFEISREWLLEKLAHCDDTNVGAAGTSLSEFRKDVEQRTVTPAILTDVPTEFGKTIRYVREQKGWTTSELAELADIDESEIIFIETSSEFDPKPRTVVQLADVCHFSRSRFIQLANHRTEASNEAAIRYAAKSSDTESITDDEYEAIRALVEVLSAQGED
jgi:transcriptional regulator with XRE-family HTH domain